MGIMQTLPWLVLSVLGMDFLEVYEGAARVCVRPMRPCVFLPVSIFVCVRARALRPDEAKPHPENRVVALFVCPMRAGPGACDAMPICLSLTARGEPLPHPIQCGAVGFGIDLWQPHPFRTTTLPLFLTTLGHCYRDNSCAFGRILDVVALFRIGTPPTLFEPKKPLEHCRMVIPRRSETAKLNVCLRAKRANTRLRICPILLSRFLCVAS